jgi:hypothetical protein
MQNVLIKFMEAKIFFFSQLISDVIRKCLGIHIVPLPSPNAITKWLKMFSHQFTAALPTHSHIPARSFFHTQ